MATQDQTDEYGFPSTINPAETPSIPLRKTLVLVNNFVVSTTQFLNRFSNLCETKLANVARSMSSLENTMCILEAKLNALATMCAHSRPAPLASDEIRQRR